MTRSKFRKIFIDTTGTNVLWGKYWKTHRSNIREQPSVGYIQDYVAETYPGFVDAHTKAHNMTPLMIKFHEDIMDAIPKNITATEVQDRYDSWVEKMTYPPIATLSNCTTATTPYSVVYCENGYPHKVPQQEKGNNPMRFEQTSAIATIQAAPSETAVQRDWLLKQLKDYTQYEWRAPKVQELTELFNLNAPKFPKGSQALLDAFTNGKFTVDQKKVDANTKSFSDSDIDDEDDFDGHGYVSERFYGITFTDIPVADRKGYGAALEAYRAMVESTEATIVIGTPAEGLAALQALKLWTPIQTAPTTATPQ